MESIQPVSTGSINAVVAPSVSGTAAPSNSQTSTQSVQDSSSNSMVMIGDQVSEMLGGIDQALASNELLKMAITLLILEVLLGQESNGDEQVAGALLAALGGSQSSSFAMFSQTTTTQITISSGTYESAPAAEAQMTGESVDVTA